MSDPQHEHRLARVVLVRHGRATGGWDDDPDPGLDALGAQQAEANADVLAPLGPWPVFSSPLRRCRETAAALATRWEATPTVVPEVTEIPSPAGVPMGERVPWLRGAMAGTWTALGPDYTAYRDAVAAWVADQRQDTVVFSHFIAINAVIGAITGDDRLVIRSLDNCSRTVVDVLADGRLALVEAGHEADTLIR
jgi:broad specificity phosphatase PhoE